MTSFARLDALLAKRETYHFKEMHDHCHERGLSLPGVVFGTGFVLMVGCFLSLLLPNAGERAGLTILGAVSCLMTSGLLIFNTRLGWEIAGAKTMTQSFDAMKVFMEKHPQYTEQFSFVYKDINEERVSDVWVCKFTKLLEGLTQTVEHPVKNMFEMRVDIEENKEEAKMDPVLAERSNPSVALENLS